MFSRGFVLFGLLLLAHEAYGNPIAVPWNRRDGQAACIGKHDGDACQVRMSPGKCASTVDIDFRNPTAPSGYIPTCMPVPPTPRRLILVAASVGLLALIAIAILIRRRSRRR